MRARCKPGLGTGKARFDSGSICVSVFGTSGGGRFNQGRGFGYKSSSIRFQGSIIMESYLTLAVKYCPSSSNKP